VKKFFLTLFVSFLTACAVSPTYHTPKFILPNQYTFSPPNKIFSHAFLHDRILTSLIYEALSGKNLDLKMAWARIRQAQAELGMSKAALIPQLDLHGKISMDKLSGNSELLSNFAIQQNLPLNYTDYKLTFDASWEIDFFGRITRAIESKRAQFESTLENQYYLSLIISAEIAKLYTQYRVFQKRIQIATEGIRLYDQSLLLMKQLTKTGAQSQIQLFRMESNRYSALSNLTVLEAESKANVAALAILVGVFPEKLFIKLNQNAPIPKIDSRQLAMGLPSDLLKNRPDIKIAERELAAASADIGVAIANQFPQFQLVADLGKDSVNPGHFFQKASSLWSLSPQLTLPIFEAGKLKNNVAAKKAIRDQKLFAYKKSILQALSDVETSLIRYHKEKEKNNHLFSALNKLSSERKLVELEYRLGKVTELELISIKLEENTLKDQSIQSEGQMIVHFIALSKSLGVLIR